MGLIDSNLISLALYFSYGKKSTVQNAVNPRLIGLVLEMESNGTDVSFAI